jgi:hypothetical protein
MRMRARSACPPEQLHRNAKDRRATTLRCAARSAW